MFDGELWEQSVRIRLTAEKQKEESKRNYLMRAHDEIMRLVDDVLKNEWSKICIKH